jgi:hypothetical protein
MIPILPHTTGDQNRPAVAAQSDGLSATISKWSGLAAQLTDGRPLVALDVALDVTF